MFSFERLDYFADFHFCSCWYCLLYFMFLQILFRECCVQMCFRFIFLRFLFQCPGSIVNVHVPFPVSMYVKFPMFLSHFQLSMSLCPYVCPISNVHFPWWLSMSSFHCPHVDIQLFVAYFCLDCPFSMSTYEYQCRFSTFPSVWFRLSMSHMTESCPCSSFICHTFSECPCHISNVNVHVSCPMFIGHVHCPCLMSSCLCPRLFLFPMSMS